MILEIIRIIEFNPRRVTALYARVKGSLWIEFIIKMASINDEKKTINIQLKTYNFHFLTVFFDPIVEKIRIFTPQTMKTAINAAAKVKKKIKYVLGYCVNKKIGDSSNKAKIGEDIKAVLYSSFLYINAN